MLSSYVRLTTMETEYLLDLILEYYIARSETTEIKIINRDKTVMNVTIDYI
jgi:hypothetical protein